MNEQEVKYTPLFLAPTYQKLRIASIEGDTKNQSRLAQLGIFPDTDILLLQKSNAGPLLLKVKGARIALDRNLASLIEVEIVQKYHYHYENNGILARIPLLFKKIESS